ncbi:MAG TPA: ferredoxin-type protein NapF [Dongiaceae bacterium]|nr:ferredoxin-type protein NapF [Dongiaceae bacterium]
MNHPIDHRRRAFLGLHAQPVVARAIRPPWTTDESLAACTGCGACVAACPERILRLDPAGLPKVDFSAGACTFCGDCAKSCTAPVFDLARSPAWQVRISISDRCLPKSGVLCESCRDICLDGAIGFARAPGRAPVPLISDSACTGCGACVSVCPAGAISAARHDGPLHA